MKKIALLGPKEWALGSINYFLQKHLSKYYSVCVLDWSHSSHINLAIGGLFDAVISESHIMSFVNIGYKFNRKTAVIPIFHHDVEGLKGTHFDQDHSEYIHKHNTYSITNKISASVFNRYGVNSEILPIGVDDSFWDKRSIKKINTIGMSYSPLAAGLSGYEDTKRLWMFDEIRKLSGLSASIIWGKNFMCGSEIYNGCDLVICTSKNEGNPLAFLECAASKIPFISTDVGIVSEFDDVMKFETVEQACSIIELLNRNPQFINDYTNQVYKSVIDKLNWSDVIEKYWIDVIEKEIELSLKRNEHFN